MFVACGIWCLADVSSISPSSVMSSPDLVLAVRGQKIGGGGRGRERRKRDQAKYESKRALIGCSIIHAKAPRACLFLSLAVRKTCQRRFIELKKI